ncbi:hypothetical protein [Roseofilum casamattae]|uniref:Uncharacterized protein n=1 Tax=Roseofilum casamattae BLCC-M143 TaxID=3022442 RepID=A0ABT7BR58_9CYAN|nr:hypothetical protein [Roseofilum casamattae]MDJ1181661.1 hypothetical protein [Roseofilum casamattae BLCC-M143]
MDKGFNRDRFMKMQPTIAIEIDKVDEEMGFSNYAIASLRSTDCQSLLS